MSLSLLINYQIFMTINYLELNRYILLIQMIKTNVLYKYCYINIYINFK